MDPAVRAPTPEELYAREADYVWSALRRLGTHENNLEDLSHEVFATAFRRLGSFDAARPVRPWLFGIAVNVASHHQRWWRRRREIPTEPHLLTHADPSANPEDSTSRAQARAMVVKALQKLPMERRAVLVMHELDEQPIPVVAETLGIPLNTAYSRLRLGRAGLVEAVRTLSEASQ